VDRYRHLLTRAVAVAGVGSIVLIALIVGVQSLAPAGTPRDALVAVLLSVLAVLVVSVVWDVAMRRAWTDELLHLVSLEKGLKSAGIREVGQESDVAWREFLNGMDEFHFIVRDLDVWLETRFAQLISITGTGKAIHVHLYIPDPDHVRDGDYPSIDRHLYEQARQRLDGEWKAAVRDHHTHRSSTLDKWALRNPPQFMIVSARQGSTHRNLLVLWPTQGGGLSSPPVSFRFEATGGDGIEVAAWIEGQLRPLRDEANRVIL
jgi:hypothetical protein